MEKVNELDEVLKIKEDIEQCNSIINKRKKEFAERRAVQKKEFEEKQAMQRQSFEEMQAAEKELYVKTQEKIMDLKSRLLSQKWGLLNSVFDIRIGDFKQELMNYFRIEENEIKVQMVLLDTMYNAHSTDERIATVKKSSNYERLVEVKIKIKKLNIFYDMRYSMDYNMKQADGISFIDHCYAENEWDTLEDTGIINNLYVKSDSIDDLYLKIPYKTLVFEAKKDYKGAVSRTKKPEYYWNTPLDAFSTCATNCLKKEKSQVLTRKIK